MKTKDALPPIKACSDVLTFGKYKGRSVEVVLGLNPGYIVWLVENEICQVEQEIYNDAQMYAIADTWISGYPAPIDDVSADFDPY